MQIRREPRAKAGSKIVRKCPSAAPNIVWLFGKVNYTWMASTINVVSWALWFALIWPVSIFRSHFLFWWDFQAQFAWIHSRESIFSFLTQKKKWKQNKTKKIFNVYNCIYLIQAPPSIIITTQQQNFARNTSFQFSAETCAKMWHENILSYFYEQLFI